MNDECMNARMNECVHARMRECMDGGWMNECVRGVGVPCGGCSVRCCCRVVLLCFSWVYMCCCDGCCWGCVDVVLMLLNFVLVLGLSLMMDTIRK